jgi:hypothetical protein
MIWNQQPYRDEPTHVDRQRLALSPRFVLNGVSNFLLCHGFDVTLLS